MKPVVRGRAGGCLMLFGAIVLVCLLISVLTYALCIAAGVGLWFALNYAWTKLEAEHPESELVKSGQKLSPAARKALVGAVCVLASLYLMTAVTPASRDNDQPGQAISQSDEEEQASAPVVQQPDPEPKLGDLRVTFIDVGQGDSELIELPDGKFMLIDAGEASSSDAVMDALDDAGVDSIDYLVASHPHADHIGGMEAVLSEYDVDEVWAPDAPADTEAYESFLDAVADKGLTIDEAVAGETIVDEDAGYEVEVLGPTEGTESSDMNDYSAIIKVTYGDTAMLFTGDAMADEIVEAAPGHVDVLKAAHHGSETGTDSGVMAETTPDYVVMSYAEGNSFGHPDQAALDVVAAGGATLYSTAANGDVTVVSDGEAVTVETERDGEVTAGVSAEERARQEAEAQAKAEEEARAQAEAEAAAQAEAERQQQTQSKTVVVTPSGKKYHVPGCSTLTRSKTLYEMTEGEAIAKGYDACKVCNP